MANSLSLLSSFLLSLILFDLALSQVSKPISSFDALPTNKYRAKPWTNVDSIQGGREESEFSRENKCHLEMDIVWKTKLAGSITTPPTLTERFSPSSSTLVYATSENYIEAIKAKNGKKEHGYPVVIPGKAFAAAPLVFDLDGNGITELIVSTTEGEIIFIRDGRPLYGRTLKVPPLKVDANWFIGLDAPNVRASLSLNQQQQTGEKQSEKKESGSPGGRKLQSSDEESEESQDIESLWQGMEGWLTPEGLKSFELFLPSELSQEMLYQQEKDPLYSPQYIKYLKSIEKEPTEGFVFVDPHIIASPVIADLDGDGGLDLIVAVSYYFDEGLNAKKLDGEIQRDKYVASGLVVFDLKQFDLKWKVHLDLTTQITSYKAYVYSSPVVADLNGDDKLDIVVATGVGFIYAFDHTGKQFSEGFPISMDSIFSPVLVEDLNNDGKPDIIAADTNSNLVCWNSKGEEIWENRLGGIPSQRMTLGDLNNDGVLDVIVATNEGLVWAVRGDNGALLENFPLKLDGAIYAEVTMAHLRPTPYPQLIIAGSDEHVYIYDSKMNCMEKLDFGEPVFNAVLVDDMVENGKIDLLVSTMKGNVYCLTSNSSYHPLMSWRSQEQSLYHYDYEGVFFLPETRSQTDISGRTFTVHFEIVDNRLSTKLKKNLDLKYHISIFVENEVMLFYKTYTSPGKYKEEITCPHHTSTARVTIRMLDDPLNRSFMDFYTAQFNVGFARLIKWLVFVPFALMWALMMTLNSKSKS